MDRQIRRLTSEAALLAKRTELDWPTSIYFEGKATGFRLLKDEDRDTLAVARNVAQTEASRYRNIENDRLKYQYFEGIAAAAIEILGLQLADDEIPGSEPMGPILARAERPGMAF